MEALDFLWFALILSIVVCVGAIALEWIQLCHDKKALDVELARLFTELRKQETPYEPLWKETTEVSIGGGKEKTG